MLPYDDFLWNEKADHIGIKNSRFKEQATIHTIHGWKKASPDRSSSDRLALGWTQLGDQVDKSLAMEMEMRIFLWTPPSPTSIFKGPLY